MEVYLKGKKTKISLSPKDFLASGGEGEIYAKGKTVYKITGKGHEMPEGKLAELSSLTMPNIICPEELLVDSKNRNVGYTMKRADDSYALCELFNKSFRQRNAVSPETVLKLVRRMQETISFVHSKNVLVVDLNELNFLVAKDFSEVFFIDVNGYQTPNFKCEAIMDSIRDRHVKNRDWTAGSDWFSFAVVSFWAFLGIHPYRGGRHQKYKTCDERMLANVSVLNPEVSYPKGACQDISAIPPSYLNWFKLVLEQGKRLAPPDAISGNIVVAVTANRAIGIHFSITLLETFAGEIASVEYFGFHRVVRVGKESFAGREKFGQNEIPFISGNTLAKATVNRGNLEVPGCLPTKTDEAFTVDGRLYSMLDGNLYEVIGGMVPSFRRIGSYVPNVTRRFEGMLVQSGFGSTILCLLPKSVEFQQVVVRELVGHKIIDAKFQNSLACVLSVNQKGTYYRHLLSFDSGYGYRIETVEVNVVAVNFVSLPNHIAVLVNESDEVEIVDKRDFSRKILSDPAMAGAKLTNHGSDVQFYRNNELFSVKVK